MIPPAQRREGIVGEAAHIVHGRSSRAMTVPRYCGTIISGNWPYPKG
jgi:hypothetical protein